MTIEIGALIGLTIAVIGGAIKIGRDHQRINSLEQTVEKLLKAKTDSDTVIDRVKTLVTDHSAEPGTHRSPDWEREIRGRLEKIENAVEVIRSKTEASSLDVVRTLGELRLEIARITPSSIGGGNK